MYGNDNGGSPAGTDKGKKRLSDTIAGTDTNGGQAEEKYLCYEYLLLERETGASVQSR